MAEPCPTVTVTLLPGTEEYAADIKSFFDFMVHKLYKHRQKGYWGDVDVKNYLGLLENEIGELKEAIESGSVAWVIEESADVANEALIIASAMMRNAVKR